MIYLLGGSSAFTGALKTSFQKTIKYPRIAFIPSSEDALEKSTYYMALTLQWFKSIGITFESATLVDKAIETDVIYLMGGDPVTQMTLIKTLKLEETIKASKIIIANSAGAINICQHTLISKDVDYIEGLYYKGLNIAKDVTVEVHYQSKHKNILKKMMKEHGIEVVYGIPEEAAILIDESIDLLGEHIEVIRL